MRSIQSPAIWVSGATAQRKSAASSARIAPTSSCDQRGPSECEKTNVVARASRSRSQLGYAARARRVAKGWSPLARKPWKKGCQTTSTIARVTIPASTNVVRLRAG